MPFSQRSYQLVLKVPNSTYYDASAETVPAIPTVMRDRTVSYLASTFLFAAGGGVLRMKLADEPQTEGCGHGAGGDPQNQYRTPERSGYLGARTAKISLISIGANGLVRQHRPFPGKPKRFIISN